MPWPVRFEPLPRYPYGSIALEYPVDSPFDNVSMTSLFVGLMHALPSERQAGCVRGMQVISTTIAHAAIVLVDASGRELDTLLLNSTLPLPALEFIAATINATQAAAAAAPDNETALSVLADVNIPHVPAFLRSRRISDATAEPPNTADRAEITLRERQEAELARLCGRSVEALERLQALPPVLGPRVAVDPASAAGEICVVVSPVEISLVANLAKFLAPAFAIVVILALAGAVLGLPLAIVLCVLGVTVLYFLVALLFVCVWPATCATELHIGVEEWSMWQRRAAPFPVRARRTPVRTHAGKTAHLVGCEVRHHCNCVALVPACIHVLADTQLAAR